MPTEKNTQTEIFKKLVRDKIPPQTEAENIFASIVLALSERVDTLESTITELRKSTTKAVKMIVTKMVSDGAIFAAAAEEGATENADTTAASSTDDAPGRPQDQTPFPTGTKVTAGGGSAPATLDQANAATTAPAAASALPVPDAGSGPAMNAAPIPKPAQKKPNGNGAKAEV